MQLGAMKLESNLKEEKFFVPTESNRPSPLAPSSSIRSWQEEVTQMSVCPEVPTVTSENHYSHNEDTKMRTATESVAGSDWSPTHVIHQLNGGFPGFNDSVMHQQNIKPGVINMAQQKKCYKCKLNIEVSSWFRKWNVYQAQCNALFIKFELLGLTKI